MSNCCKTTNPLRRDGTSQSQRFPLALAETYVQIDERSHSDILNFIRGFAEEVNYYAANNQVDGTWLEFFERDLSFLLAENILVRVDDYKATFDALLETAQTEFAANGSSTEFVENIQAIFASFLQTTPSSLDPNQDLPSLLSLINAWVDRLPASSEFSDDQAYSFRDLVSDGRNRLAAIIKRLQVAHEETVNEFAIASTDLDPWAGLLAGGWNIYAIPTGAEEAFYITGDSESDLERVYEVLKAAMDALVGMIQQLQASVPAYLQQSLTAYPWHNPQNALFLAFMQLFDYAKTHLNSLGRKHLLYEYEDVLRFSQRPLVSDEAVAIFALRKGSDPYLLTEGTLLKAGKDADGKALNYEVVSETVINHAALRALMSVHVERKEDTVIGLYASSIANSSDGIGGALPSTDPKWNMFGEGQSQYDSLARTMPDGKVGFAIASPILVMKEGYRAVDISFEIPESNLPTITDATKLAQIEANILHALQASYTQPKGWADAQIASVFIVTSDTRVEQLKLAPAFVRLGYVLLTIKVVMTEGDLPVSAYSEKVHQLGMNTPWPVIKLSLEGLSYDFGSEGLALEPVSGTSLVSGLKRLYGGQICLESQTILTSTFVDPSKVAAIEDYLALEFDPYSVSTNYLAGDRVYYAGEVFQVLNNLSQDTIDTRDQNPLDYAEFWKELKIHAYDVLQNITPTRMLIHVNVLGAKGVLLENDLGRLKSEKPFPMFGGQPVIGSRFYIGSQEIFGKQLDALDINLVWQDPPDNMGLYYKKYEGILSAAEIAAANSTTTCGKDCTCCEIDTYEVSTESGPPKNSGGIRNSTVMDRNTSNYRSDRQAKKACNDVCVAPSDKFSNSDWQVDVSLLYEGNWEYLDTKPLFYKASNGTGAGLPHTIDFDETYFTEFERDLNLEEPTKLVSNAPAGFLRLELVAPYIAFGHKYYKDLYVQESLNAAALMIPDGGAPVFDFPSEPYTPIVKEINLDYTSHTYVDFSEDADLEEIYEARVDQFFHLHPFGHSEEHAYLSQGEAISLFPQYEEEGYLYIGLEGLVAPCTLSVLFQLAEGSADPDLEGSAPTWSILVDNRWRDLEPRDILFDSTDELISSGVIRFDFDEDFANGSTMLNKDLHWLRVRVPENAGAYMKAVEIAPQAVMLSFVDNGNELSHLEKALPANTINGLVVNSSSIKSVKQPYGSFGGRMPEGNEAFITRVSERLRHKQRAINIWDFERLVLEEFPSIYKVKCLNHSEYKSTHTNGQDWEISPGYVTMVCIPDLRNLNGVNPFEPKTSVRTLADVKRYLEKYMSAWVDLKVTNPLYEQVIINCEIGFVEGKDPGYYIQVLEAALQAFLSPWAFDHEKEIVFGGKIHRSQIVQFIEQQSYVDFVVHFQLDHQVGTERYENVQEAAATTGRSILVSASSHDITSLKPDCSICTPDATSTSTVECCATEA